MSRSHVKRMAHLDQSHDRKWLMLHVVLIACCRVQFIVHKLADSLVVHSNYLMMSIAIIHMARAAPRRLKPWSRKLVNQTHDILARLMAWVDLLDYHEFAAITVCHWHSIYKFANIQIMQGHSWLEIQITRPVCASRRSCSADSISSTQRIDWAAWWTHMAVFMKCGLASILKELRDESL